MTANNSSNQTAAADSGGDVIVVDGTLVHIERGPAWLADLLIGPPTWVQVTLAAIAVVTIGLAALGYRRHGLDREVLEEMAQIGTIVFCITVSTIMLRELAITGYLVNVLAGTAGGYALAQYLIRSYYRQESASTPS